MPEFKDLIKDLYTTKGRELTEEKLNYIEKEYGGGKEEEFIKDFYATIGEDLTEDKFDYIRTEYLKKKEPTFGLPLQKTSANAPQFFGTPSVPTSGEPLESKSKLPSTQKIEPSYVSPLQGIKGAPPPLEVPKVKESKLFEIKKLPSERPEFVDRLKEKVEIEDRLLNDPSYALMSGTEDKKVKIYTEKNKAVASERGQSLDELYSDMDEYLADFLDERQKQEYIGQRGRTDVLKRILKAKAAGQPTEALQKQYDEMVTSFSEAKSNLIANADSKIKELRLALEETPTEDKAEILDEIKLLEASKKPFFVDVKKEAKDIVEQQGLKGDKSDQEKVREYAHALMRERSDLREMLGMKGTRMSIMEALDQMTFSGDDPVVQRLVDVETRLKSVAPIALINETPITEKEGALGVLGKEFLGSLAPVTKSRVPTSQTIAMNAMEGLGLAGVENPNKDVVEVIEKTSKPYEDWSAKDIAQMTGTTGGFMPKFVIATIVTEGAGSLAAVSPYWRSIKILSERGSLGAAAGNNIIRTMQANSYGRGLLKTAFGGAEFATQSAVESQIFQADKDEVTALTGFAGGGFGKIAGKGVELVGKGLSKSLTSLFGTRAPQATNRVINFAKTAYGKTKEVNEKAIGEVGEETGEELAGLWQDSENGTEFFKKISEQYGDPSKSLKFFLSTYMMGLAFGSGTYFGKWSNNKSGQTYSNLSPKDKAVADNIISELKQEQNKAETDAGVEAIEESDLSDKEKDSLKKEITKQGEVINSVIEGESTADKIEEFSPKEELTKEYERTKEPTIGATDVTEEGLGVATETGTQGVEGANIPSEEVAAPPSEPTKTFEQRVEETARALEVGSKIKWDVYGNENVETWEIIGETKTRGGKDAYVVSKQYVQSDKDGTTYSKEYADANGIKYSNEPHTVEQVVPKDELVKAVEDLIGAPETKAEPVVSAKEEVRTPEQEKQIELLDLEKKIAQLEKDLRTAPVKPRRGVSSQKQIRIQIRNYKEQLRELKGLPPKKKPTDSVLRINLRAFGAQVDESNLPHGERVVLAAIGSLSATDRDIVNLDGNAKLRNQTALKTKGGLSLDQIVTDYINENELDPDMSSDLRDDIIDFVNKGDVYKWLDRIREREAQVDPDAMAEDSYYNYGYQMAEELELTDEEISELEYEIGQLTDLTQEEYEQLKKQFTEEGDTRAGEGVNIVEGKADISEAQAEEKLTKEQRKEIASAKIDEVAQALKAILPKIEGEKLGAGQDEIIDIIAKAVKALVNTGIEIDEAIKRVKEKLAESFNGVDAIDDNEIKAKISVTESIPPKSREEQNQKAKSYGFKNAPHALNSVNKEMGTTYEKFSDIPTDVLEEVAVAKGLAEPSENAEKVISDIDKVMMGEESPNKMAKSLIAGLKRSEKYTEADKERITEKVGEFYMTQPIEKLKEIGQAFIDELGGLDKAVSEAMLKNSTLPPTVRIFVLGQGILNAKAMQDAATNKAQKDKLADYQTDMFDAMDNLVRDYGRAINYVKEFYKPSALAAARKVRKDIDEINRLRNNQVNKSAKAVKDIVEDKADVTESVNEAVEDVLEGSKETIEALQKEIDALRKQIAGGRKGSKSNPINLGVSKEQVKDARKRLLGLTYANAPLNPEFWRDMGILAADAIQEGFRKMGDFYEYMRKSLNGKYSDSYGDVYLKARDKAIEMGAKESDFSTDEEAQAELDRIQKETDAEKIARLTAAKAKAESKKAKKETDAAKIAAKKIISDAQKELNNVTTKKEQDAVNKIINIVAKKAKELSKSQNKPTGNSVAELVMFAFEQADNGLKIWNEAQKEVYSMIEKDTDMTKEEKDALVDFLDKYKDGVFDILLTKGQKDRIIKEKLIEAGYATEKGGKVVLNLEPIIARAKTIDEAVSAITKAISKETGLSESELSDFTKAIKARLTDIVADKKAQRIKNYLKRNERRLETALSSGRKRKTQTQKLLDLYNAGGLSDKRVKEVLAKELGIIYFTAEDEAFLEKKFEELDKAPLGAEAEKIEEEIQAYIETKTKGLFSKALYERVRARLLSSPLTFVKNLSGFLDTFVMGIQQLIVANKGVINPKNWKDGKFDTNTLKVLGNSIQYVLNTSMDIMVNGGVDLGTAFSESTGTKEGTPRVRYLEYTKNTLPDLYVFLGGKKINLNLYNVALKGEKYVGRGLSFADSWNQIMLQEMKTYNYIKFKLMASDPTLTDRQASQKAYDTMYALDIEKATAEVSKEFESRGVTLDMNKKSDRYRFFRRVYEKVSQSRGEEVVKAASEFASRYTYKQGDVGIMTPVKNIMTYLKLFFNTSASKLRAEGKKKENESIYNLYESLAKAMEGIGEGLFTAYMPFIQGVANILEKGLELYPPYGIAKATGYLTSGAFVDKVSKDKNAASNLYGKSGEFFVRALVGLAVIEMFKALADDDEDDDKPAIYGAGEEDYRKGQAIKTLRPPNTIVIDGRPINLDYLGSFGVALKVEAALLDLERYNEKYQKLDNEEKVAAQMQSVANSILIGSYTQGFADLVAGKLNEKARAAELGTRLMIPYTNAVRQGYQLIDPKAKKPISFMENMAKYSGLVAGWTLDKPAFDYRGREYKTGQLYTGSPSGFVGMFAVMDKLADDYDKIILKATDYDMAFTGFEKTDPRYYIVDSETGKERQMTDEEYYDVMFEKNKIFDSLIKEKLSDPFYGQQTKEDLLSNSKYAKKYIGKLNSIAKKEAFQKVFGEVPVYIEEEISINEQ